MTKSKRKRIELPKVEKSKSNGHDRNTVKEDNFIKKMLDDVDRHTPKIGYNLVGIDDFEPFGEQLFTIGHYETYEAAQEQYSGNTAIYPHKREE